MTGAGAVIAKDDDDDVEVWKPRGDIPSHSNIEASFYHRLILQSGGSAKKQEGFGMSLQYKDCNDSKSCRCRRKCCRPRARNRAC